MDNGLGLCFEIHTLAVFKFQVQSIFRPVPLVMHIRTTARTSIKVFAKNCRIIYINKSVVNCFHIVNN